MEMLPRSAARLLSVPSAPTGRVNRIDSYLRRADTPLAGLLGTLSPTVGQAYARSAIKRMFGLVLASLALLFAAPLIAVLAAINKVLQPNHRAFFIQERVGRRGKPVKVIKIRSMRPARTGDDGAVAVKISGFQRLLRRFYLDELPQLAQVAAGQLSLVGIRILPIEIYACLERIWSPQRFDRWRQAYDAAPLGLTGLHQVYRRAGKEDELRFHRDVFYADHASLGFDLYLIWRTICRVLHLLSR
jgi:lipopolysaccharide/colanic/teichoic acid biosynthesis glycosyltransferase